MSMEEYESHYIDPVIYTRTYSLNILKKAMRRFVLIILVAFYFASSVCARLSDGFRIESVGRSVKDFQLDSIKLTSPIDYYLSRAWVRISGKAGHWADISTSKFYNDPNAPDETVDDDFRDYVLNETIDEIVFYRDSVAALVTHTDGEDLYMLNYC